jgi:hypothetical protein
MANITPLKALSGYFNTGDGYSVESAGGENVPATVAGVPVKRPVRDFAAELRVMSDVEKMELAQLVVAETGDTLVSAK